MHHQFKLQIPIAKYSSMVMWVLASFMIMSSMFIMKNNINLLIEWDLLSSSTISIKLPVVIDTVSTLYSSVVLMISANVLSFSSIYMKEDKFINRFTILVIMFVVSMNMLVFIPHMMILLLGWDGLGITSFILVIYYQNKKSLAAGMITAMTNRIGDVMLLLSIAWTLDQGHWNILHMINNHNSMLIMLAIMVAAMTKSAQMPFSSWLPAAMAAPTPVSALVHSSTLVTAGVFMLIRFYPFLHQLEMFNKTILFIGMSTMLMASFSAVTECDMKKIIALSTLSQLGMMMTSLGLNLPTMAFIHMTLHALFKALLFIAAGSLIMIHDHSQDLRSFGNLTNQTPVTSSAMLISQLALCGAPWLAGFYSKDLIMESASFNQNNMFMLFLAFMSVSLTPLYSFRSSSVTIWSPRLSKPSIMMMEWMNVNTPMMIMSFLSTTFGAIIMWIMPTMITEPSLTQLTKMMPVIMMNLGLLMGIMLVKFMGHIQSTLMTNQKHHFASCAMWFLAQMSSQPFVKLSAISSHTLLKYMDQSWLEMTSAQGMNKMIISYSSKMTMLNPNMPSSYLSSMMIGMAALCITSIMIM